jgi:hypothetical protein
VFAIAGAFVSFCFCLHYSTLITADVNEALGTHYERLFGAQGNKIWDEHGKAFPSSKRRLYFATTFSCSFGLLFLSGWLAPR